MELSSGFEGSTSTNLPGPISTVTGFEWLTPGAERLDVLDTLAPVSTVSSISSSSLRMSIFFGFLDGLAGKISTLLLGGEDSKGPDDVELEMLITEVAEMLGGRTFFPLGGWDPTLKEGGRELRSDVPLK